MEIMRISVVDAVSFGFRAVLHHVRLFFFILLEAILLSAVVVTFVGFLNRDLAYSVIVSIKEAAYYQGSIFALNIATATPIISLISIALLSVVFIGFDLGFKKVALQVYDYDNSCAGTVFRCFSLVPQASVSWLLYGITPALIAYVWSYGMYIPSSLDDLYSVPVSAGLFALLGVGLLLMFRCMFFTYFIVDKHAGPFAALRMSWNATRGHGWDLLAFFFVIKMISYIGYMTLFGWILVWPLTTLAYVYVYRHMHPIG